MTAPPIERPPSPYEQSRQAYAAQLVDDIRDVLRAELIRPEVSRHLVEMIDGAAVAVTALVYPTLAEARDRDDEGTLLVDAAGILDRLGCDSETIPFVDVQRLVASLLRDLRRLYDDAQNVREQYGESCRRAYDERDQAQRGAADAVDAVRRIRRALRRAPREGVDAAMDEIRAAVRHLRPGREP